MPLIQADVLPVWAEAFSNLREPSPTAPAAPMAAVLRKSRRLGCEMSDIVVSLFSWFVT